MLGLAFDTPGPAVLVVEDETLIRMMLVLELEDVGFQVLEAPNADVAMTLIADHRDIAAVVTDVMMPGTIDGLGLARWMRDAAPQVPIVIATACAELPDIAAINPAIVRVITKPYRAAEVIACLSEIGTVVGTQNG